MKKADVQIGQVYTVKVSGKVAPVRIDGMSPFGGWTGTNLRTGRQIRIRGGQRLRMPWLGKVNARKEEEI